MAIYVITRRYAMVPESKSSNKFLASSILAAIYQPGQIGKIKPINMMCTRHDSLISLKRIAQHRTGRDIVKDQRQYIINIKQYNF